MIKERNEIDSAYMWDLTPLFKSDEEWEKELDSFDEKVSTLAKYQGTLKDAKTIHSFYEELTEVSGIFEDLFCYASLRRSLIEYGFFTRDAFGKTYNKCV